MTAAVSRQARRRLRLGELLVNAGAISPQQLEEALAEQKRTRRRLGQVLVSSGYLDEERLLEAISEQLNVPRIDLASQPPDAAVARRLPELAARRLRALPVAEQVDGFLVAMADPTDLLAEDELERLLGRPVTSCVVAERALLKALDTVYLGYGIEELAEELGEEISAAEEPKVEGPETSDALISRFVTTLLDEALRAGASDVHIEPGEDRLYIRFRIDGVLREQPVAQKNVAASLVSRLKLSAGLNIAEKRLPQDGRFRVTVRNRTLDVRMATMPTQHGEAVVMRLLDQTAGILDLAALGLPGDILDRLRNIAHRPYGMLLVTGPTGSGKSTTLYATLSELNTPDRKIITIEDPVEYRLARINQIQIQPQIGLDFARVLRAALRHDPDVVLVGEMRDRETVEIGLRAAITGHLVMSTLHTNDAPSTAIRLLDMGAAGFLVASALQAVLAQRLLRRLCEQCRVRYTPDRNERGWLADAAGDEAGQNDYFAAAGCDECNRTGYRGRIGVYELLELDAAMNDALRRNDTADFARAARASDRYRPLEQAALTHARAGITDLAEVLRVAGTARSR